jgi:hypothetical protein
MCVRESEDEREYLCVCKREGRENEKKSNDLVSVRERETKQKERHITLKETPIIQ